MYPTVEAESCLPSVKSSVMVLYVFGAGFGHSAISGPVSGALSLNWVTPGICRAVVTITTGYCLFFPKRLSLVGGTCRPDV